MELTFNINFQDPSLFSFNDRRVKYTDGIFSLQQRDGNFDNTNPAVISLQKVYAEQLYALETEETGDVTYVLRVDGVDTYWDGTAWVASDRTVEQSNNIDEINTNIETLTGFTSVQLVFFLNSIGVEDARLESARFRYEPVDTALPVETVKVFLNVRDFNNEVEELEFTVQPSRRGIIGYKSSTILLPGIKTYKTNGGYIEIDLVDTDNMDESVYYTFRIGNTRIMKTIPAMPLTVNLLDLPDLGAV